MRLPSMIPRVRLTILLTLLVGLLLSAYLSYSEQQRNAETVSVAVKQEADKQRKAILERMRLYQYGVRGTRGSIITAGEYGMTRETYRRYSLSRSVDKEFPGAMGFGFVRLVPQAEEAQFLKAARNDGRPDFHLLQLNPHRGDRYVIQYLEPAERNAAAIGLDIASDPVRRAAAEKARLTGQIQLTAPLTLLQASGARQQSFVLLLPIYRGGVMPDTPAARQTALMGWSLAALNAKAVLDTLPLNITDLHLTLSDVTDPSHPVRFFESGSAQGRALYPQSMTQDVFGRRWQMTLAAHPSFIQRLHLSSPQQLFWTGALISLLVAALAGLASLMRLRQQAFMAQQSRLAAIVESSEDAIIGKTLQGVVTSWNKGAERLFGYPATEAMGKTIAELIVPDDLQPEERHILEQVRLGQRIPHFETTRQRKDGSLLPVSVTVSPILGEHGNVIGASKTLRDISVQKQAEQEIMSLNTQLEHQVEVRTAELRQANLLVKNVLRASSEVSIIATDIDGVIRLFNRGAEHILGYTADEMVGKCTPAILHLPAEVERRGAELTAEYGETIEGFRVFVHKAEHEGAETREWTYVRKDGTHCMVSLAITAMRDEQRLLTGFLGIATDITDQQQQRAALTAARDQLEVAANVAELGVWTWELETNALKWNERMYEIYGYDKQAISADLNYAHWRARVHPDDLADAETRLLAAIEGKASFNKAFRIVLPDGAIRIIQPGAHIEHNTKGEPIRVTGINRDITTQQQLETSLRIAKEQADAASAAKSAFLANMSHEIRTPMNAVLGLLQLVQSTTLDERQRDYLGKTQVAAQSLLGVLNDILDFSKVEAGKLQLDLHPFDVEQLMRDMAIILSSHSGQKDIELLFQIDPEVPRTLVGDRLRLQQILINLAGNALKFTLAGEVIVRLACERRSATEVMLNVEIQDTGIGMTEEQVSRVFDGFTQAETSTTRRFGGTGLGLAICQRLVQLMGGTLTVHSLPDQGSTFSFAIPMIIADPLPMLSMDLHDLPQLRVLVVDDNPSALEIMEHLVRNLGWAATLATTGEEALASIRAAARLGEPFDIVLLDWRLPGLDGLRVAEQIKECAPEVPPPVIIMITAYGREVLAKRKQARNAPFADFLTKPVTPVQLIESIKKALSAPPAFESDPAPLVVQPNQPLAGMQLLVVEDNALNRQVAFELLMLAGAHVTLADGGLEGVAKVLVGDTVFDAVLMDVQMPDIDGLEATRRIRAHDRFQSLPIIAMTANASNSDRETCLAAGMNDHVGKPIDLGSLTRTLLMHVRQTGSIETLPQPVDIHLAQGVNIPAIMDRFMGNRLLFRKVLTRLLPDSQLLLDDLYQAVQMNHHKPASAALHALKGMTATLGAEPTALLAYGIEQQIKLLTDTDQLSHIITEEVQQQLKARLQADYEALATAFADSSPAEDASLRTQGTGKAALIEALADLRPLLQTANLAAMDSVDALLHHATPEWHPLLQPLADAVEGLDFPQAIEALDHLVTQLDLS